MYNNVGNKTRWYNSLLTCLAIVLTISLTGFVFMGITQIQQERVTRIRVVDNSTDIRVDVTDKTTIRKILSYNYSRIVLGSNDTDLDMTDGYTMLVFDKDGPMYSMSVGQNNLGYVTSANSSTGKRVKFKRNVCDFLSKLDIWADGVPGVSYNVD